MPPASIRLCPQSAELIRRELALAERDRELQAFVTANDGEDGNVLRLEPGDEPDDVVGMSHRDPVDGGDHIAAGDEALQPEDVDLLVAAAEAGPGAGVAGRDVHDQRAVVDL